MHRRIGGCGVFRSPDDTGGVAAEPAVGPVSARLWRPDAPADAAVGRALDVVAAALVEDGIEVQPLDWDDHVRTLLEDREVILAYEALPEPGARARAAAPALAPATSAAYHDARIRRDVSRTDLLRRLGAGGVVVGPAVREQPWHVLRLSVLTVAGLRTADGSPLDLQVIGVPGHRTGTVAFADRLEALVADLVID